MFLNCRGRDVTIIFTGLKSHALPPATIPALIASLGVDSPMNMIIPFMVQDAELRLRNEGYNILALALPIKSPEILCLQNLTIFRISENFIFFKGGEDLTNNLRYRCQQEAVVGRCDASSSRYKTPHFPPPSIAGGDR